MPRKLTAAAALLVLSTGCAETYRGRRPDLTLTEPAQQEREIRDFTMEEAWAGIEMGKEKYTLGSLMPVVDHVSPAGAEEIDTGRDLAFAGEAISTAGAAAVVGSFFVESGDTKQALLWGGIAVSVVSNTLFGFLSRAKVSEGIDRYNRDLALQLSNGSGSGRQR